MGYVSPLRAGLVDLEIVAEWAIDAQRRGLAAEKYSATYERRKPEIEAHHRRQLLKNHGTVEDHMLRAAMDKSYTLNDALNGHAWNRDEANRLNQAILAQKALREMIAWDERANNNAQ